MVKAEEGSPDWRSNGAVRVEMFGRLSVASNGDVFHRFRSRQAGSLLAYLAYHSSTDHSREKLADLFWPDAEPSAARLSLRVALSSLRAILEPPNVPTGSVLQADRLSVRLNPSVVSTDVEEFERGWKAAKRPRAARDRVPLLRDVIDLYVGPLLPSFYDEWIHMERERHGNVFAECLRQLRDDLHETGEAPEAIVYAYRYAAERPYEEDAHEKLVQLLTEASRFAEAAKAYTSFAARMKSGLGLSPSAKLKALVKSLPSESSRPIARVKRVDASLGPSARSPRDRMPPSLGRFVGREKEVAQLQDLFSADQGGLLVTITGAGGCGKTRLLLESVRRIGARFEGRICVVDLTGLKHASAIPFAISSALGLPDPSLFPSAILDDRLLLALDNMEHLLDEEIDAAAYVSELLDRAPRISCLVTSRQKLNIETEVQLALFPLEVPPEGAALQGLIESPSVGLFVDRARRVHPYFSVTKSNASSIGQLCRILEGLPLSIELAAAWSHTLSPAEIVRRLERDSEILVSRDKRAPVRRRSLKAVIESSLERLPLALSEFLSALTVFRGGWTEEAAALVGKVRDAALLLSELQERSLVFVRDWRSSKRFHMMEAVRELVSGKLESQMRDLIEFRHSVFVGNFLAEAKSRGRCADQIDWLLRIEAEEHNIQKALAYCETHDHAAGLRIICDVAPYWEVDRRDAEIAAWLNKLSDAPPADPALRGQILLQTARMHTRNLDGREAVEPAKSAIAIFQAQGLELGVAEAKLTLAVALSSLDSEAARVAYEGARKTSKVAGHRPALVDSLLGVAGIDMREGLIASAEEQALQALSIAQEDGDIGAVPELQCLLSEIYRESGAYGKAAQLAKEALAHLLETRDSMLRPRSYRLLGMARASAHCFGEARRYLQKSISLYEKAHLFSELGFAQIGLADLEFALGRESDAECLYRTAMDSNEALSRTRHRALRSLSLVALQGDRLPEAIGRLEASFAVSGPFHCHDMLRFLEACGLCFFRAGRATEAETLMDEIRMVRERTGLAEDPLDRVTYARILERSPLPGVDVGRLLENAEKTLERIKALPAYTGDRPL